MNVMEIANLSFEAASATSFLPLGEECWLVFAPEDVGVAVASGDFFYCLSHLAPHAG